MRKKRALFGFLLFISAVTICAATSFAQGGSATISGRVTDAGGLAVVGAKVQAVHVETDTTSSTETNDAGFYNLPNLEPGTYRITVEKEGFEQMVSTGLQIHAADNIAMPFSLKVGTVSQTVTVEGEAPVVNTTTSSLGGLVNDEKIADLPLNGRNFIDLSLLQPGVTQNYNQGSGGGAAGTWFSSNGAPVRSNYVTIDGASMITQLGGSAGSQSGNTLGVDGIKEYVVLTHNYSAEYGMTMGSQMIIISKGGTNQFHGTAFEYLRNSDLDAKNHFDTPASAGLTAAGVQRRLPPFQRNNFGGSFGGPIKKDKTFFFANFEGLRQKLGFTATDIVPAGNCHGPANAIIWNGSGTQPAGSLGPCTQLGSNPSASNPSVACPAVSNCVLIAPVMAPILALYPYNPAAMNSSSYSAPTTNYTTDNFGQIRIDQNISDKDSFFGRYTIEDGVLNNGSGNISTLPTGTAFPQYVTLLEPNRNQFLTLSENHILSPTLLNTARLSYSRTSYHVEATTAGVLTAPNVSFVAGNPIGSMQVGGLTNLGVGLGEGPNPPNIHTQNVYTFSDDIFFTRGKNAFKFGTLINRFNQGLAAAQAPDGQIQFGSLATMFTGVFGNYNSQVQGLDTEFDFIYNTFGFYVQDDYRATSRLTFNLGLRYEFNTTPNEINGFQAGIRNMKTDAALTPGPVIDDKSYLNFSPRLGFAYDVFGNGKTAVRGGAGILYDVGNLGNLLYQGVISMPPIAAQGTYNNTSNYVLGSQPGLNTTGLPFFTYPPGTSSNNLHMDNYHEGQPHVYQFNLAVEQQLPFGIGMSVAYVGSRGANLIRAEEANPYTPSSFVNGLPVWDPYTCAGVLSGYNSGGCAANPAYVRLNPNWSSSILIATGSLSWYDSLQVVLNKRLGHGLEFQSAYTWGHNLDTTNGQGYSSDCGGTDMANGDDPFNENVFDKGQACSDIRQNWRFNALYYLPTIKSNGWESKFTNGWWTGSIVSVQTGYPFSAGENTNRAQSGLFTGQVISERASINTAASIAANPCTSQPGTPAAGSNPCAYTPIPFNPQTVYTGNPNEWINPAMFSLQPIGTLGNTSRGLLHGPDLAQWNLTLAKDTAAGFLGEKGSVEFRWDVFNAFNHTNYGSPSGAVFTGALTATDEGPYSETPVSTVGKITTTATTSRQMQFSLRLIF